MFNILVEFISRNLNQQYVEQVKEILRAVGDLMIFCETLTMELEKVISEL